VVESLFFRGSGGLKLLFFLTRCIPRVCPVNSRSLAIVFGALLIGKKIAWMKSKGLGEVLFQCAFWVNAWDTDHFLVTTRE